MTTTGRLPHVAVMHPGQMGAAIAAQARLNNATVQWCPAGRSPMTAQRAEVAGLEAVPSVVELLDRADVVLSICPPAAAEDVAGQIASHGYRGLVVEANAISPTCCRRITDILIDAGARAIDGAIIGPPPGQSASTRLYLAGDTAEIATVSVLFTGTAVQVVAMDERLGRASALKMAFACYQKTTRALAAIAHALADRHDVSDDLLAEARRLLQSPLAHPDYTPSVAARAWRWAPEMLEIADTLNEANLPADLAYGANQVFERWLGDKDHWDLTTAEALQHLHHTA